MNLRLWPRDRFWLWSMLALLASIFWAWYTATPAEQLYQGRQPAPMEGFPAPDILLPVLDDGEAHLADLRGRPVILNFWASWCPPCRLEMPALQRMHQIYRNRVAIIGVNAAHLDRPEAMRNFLKQRGITFPIWLDDGSAMETYRVHALPTTFFIDAHGTICEVVVGGPMAEALLRTRIASLEEGCSPFSP